MMDPAHLTPTIVTSAFLTIEEALDRLDRIERDEIRVNDVNALVLMTITRIAVQNRFDLGVPSSCDVQSVRRAPFWDDLCKKFVNDRGIIDFDGLANALVVALNTVESIVDIASAYYQKIGSLLEQKRILCKGALSRAPWTELCHPRWTCTNLDSGVSERFANGGGFSCPLCEQGDCQRARRYNLVFVGSVGCESKIYVCRNCADSWPLVWRLLHVLSYFDDAKHCSDAARRLGSDLHALSSQ